MLPRACNHHKDCEWHFDQYPWECTCGAIPDPHQFRPKWLKATVEPDQQTTTSEEKE